MSDSIAKRVIKEYTNNNYAYVEKIARQIYPDLSRFINLKNDK